MTERRYRVLVNTGRARIEGGTTIYEQEWVECSQQAAMRYASGDPRWRDDDGEASSSRLERFLGWVRLGWLRG